MEAICNQITKQIPEIRLINKFLVDNLISGKSVSISKINELIECSMNFYLPKISSNLYIIEGSIIRQIQRYDKYILFTLSNKTIAKIMFIKLGKLGNINIIKDIPFKLRNLSKDTNIIFMLTVDNNPYALMTFSSIEEFGYAINIPDFIKIKKFGPDIEYTDTLILSRYFERIVDSKGTSVIRNILCNEEIIAGIGDYIADEVLHELNIHPLTKAETLSSKEIHSIIEKTKEFIFKEKIDIKIFGKYKCCDCGGRVYKKRVSHDINRSKEIMFVCPVCQQNIKGNKVTE